MTAEVVRAWFEQLGAEILLIEPGSPWENGYCESFNGKLRDELLNGEIFHSLKEAKVVIEQWRNHYNTERPHSALGLGRRRRWPMAQSRCHSIDTKSCSRLTIDPVQNRSGQLDERLAIHSAAERARSVVVYPRREVREAPSAVSNVGDVPSWDSVSNEAAPTT